jgi:hypothetical protein
MKPLAILAFAIVAFIAFGCGGTDKQVSGGATIQPTAKTTPTTEAPTAVPTPETGLTFEVADFVEYPPGTQLYSGDSWEEKEGWRVVGLFLDVTYLGGMTRNFLGCGYGNNFITISLETPNDATYELQPPNDGLCGPGGPGGTLLVPGARLRFYFQGWVPASLPSIQGSKATIHAVVHGWEESSWKSPQTFEDTLDLNKGKPFYQGSIKNVSGPNEAVEMKDVTLQILSVSYEGEPEDWGLSVTYRITNNSPYEFDAGFDSGTIGNLIDARGYPYELRQMEDCQLPPGYTKDCVLEGERYIQFDPHVFPNDQPDLSNALVILSMGQDQDSYSFRWP